MPGGKSDHIALPGGKASKAKCMCVEGGGGGRWAQMCEEYNSSTPLTESGHGANNARRAVCLIVESELERAVIIARWFEIPLSGICVL